MLGHMLVLFLTFWGVSILLSIVIAPTYLPANSVLGFYLPTSLPTLVICCLFNNSHLIGVIIMVSICVFLMVSDVEHLCIYLLAICESFFVKKVYSVHLLIFKSWIFFFFLAIELYEFIIRLCINPLSDIWLTNIFSHSLGCLFLWLVVSFAVQKYFNLILSNVFIFAFVAFSFGVKPKKIISKTSIKEFTTMLISLILFEFIFMYGVR